MSNIKDFSSKLRNSGLRPTKQRIKICEILFNKEKQTLGDYLSKTKLLRTYWFLSIVKPITNNIKEGKTIANPGEKPFIIAIFPNTLRNKSKP